MHRTVTDLIRTRANLQAAARNGTVAVIPDWMTSATLRALGLDHLRNPVVITRTGLILAQPVARRPQ